MEDPPRSSNGDPPSDALGRLESQMVVLARRIEHGSRRITNHARMDRAAYLIARTLDDTGAASVNEIARSLGLDGSTVTRQVAAMEAKQFVERSTRPEDGRAWDISLTENGQAEMAAVSAARRQRFARYLADWPADDIDRLGRLLERFNQAIVNSTEPTDPAAQAEPPRQHPEHRRSVVQSRRRR